MVIRHQVSWDGKEIVEWTQKTEDNKNYTTH